MMAVKSRFEWGAVMSLCGGGDLLGRIWLGDKVYL